MVTARGSSDNSLKLVAGIAVTAIVVLLGITYVIRGNDQPDRVASNQEPSWSPKPTEAPATTAPAGETSTPEGTDTTSVATATTAPTRSGKAELTMAFAGDVLPHSAVNDRAQQYGQAAGKAYDYAPMFEPMKPLFSGVDMAVCHMEVPLAPEGEKPSTYPSFGAPAELVPGIASAGFDGCSTASNHSLDRGRNGLDYLLDTFDANDMSHNGTARTEPEGNGRATIYDIDGVKVAHMSWAYDFNGYRIPADAPWSVNKIDTARMVERAAEARAEGADLVVVSVHWCCEYHHDPNAEQEQIAAALTASPDIDLVIGHHAHVVQPVSKVNDKFVVWGLGNQVSNMTQPERRDGLTVRVTAKAQTGGSWTISQVEAIPTYVDQPSFRILPVVDTLKAGDESAALNEQLRGSYERTSAVLATRPTDGVVLAPLP